MGSILFNVPSSETWVQKLDDTFWEKQPGPPYPTWDGSKWTSPASADCIMYDIGTWANGYRPAKIRLTFDGGGTGVWGWEVTDTNGGRLADIDKADSGVIHDLNFTTYDINQLFGGITNAEVHITNIEFLEE